MKKIFYTLILLISTNLLFSQLQEPDQFKLLESRNLRTFFNNSNEFLGRYDASTNSNYGLEYPKQANKDSVNSCMFVGEIWLVGKNSSGEIKSSCYKYNNGLSRYHPGPIDIATGKATTLSSSTFNKIWKVSKTDIYDYLAIFLNNSIPINKTKIPDNILTWPAKGNDYYKNTSPIKDDLAPYNDVNNNGLYDPENGDFPKIKGDTCFFTVLNDYDEVDGLGVELHLMAYVIDADETANTIFYDLDVTKKTKDNLEEFIFSLFVDPDVGYSNDDYIGCDTNQNIAYAYNADSFDNIINSKGYGFNPPVVAIKFLNKKMGSFNYFINGNGQAFNDPSTDNEFYNFMNGLTRTGSPMTQGGDGASGTIPTKFVFPSDPCDNNGWSMKSANLPPKDIRFLMSSELMTLNYNQPEKFNFKVSVFEQSSWPPCINESLVPQDSAIIKVNDSSDNCRLNFVNAVVVNDPGNLGKGSIEVTVSSNTSYNSKWSSGESNVLKLENKKAGEYSVVIYAGNNCYFDSTFTISDKSTAGISNVSEEVKIYPIPAKNELSIDFNNNKKIDRISIFDLNGKVIKTMPIDTYISHYEISLTELAKGVYLLKIEGESIHQTSKFTKE